MVKVRKLLAFIVVGAFCMFQVVGVDKLVCAQEKRLSIDKKSPLVKYGLVDPNQSLSQKEYEDMLEYEKYEEKYRNLVTRYERKGYTVNLSLDDYVEKSSNGIKINIRKYLVKNSVINEMNSNSVSLYSSSSNSNSTYYYNTGTKRPSDCVYSSYYLLQRTRKGDIFYEATGGKGVTGHVGIVEGKFYYSGKYYIRIIEATPAYGVKRGVLDDRRAVERLVSLWRVKIKDAVRSKSVDFAISQLNKGYYLDVPNKDTSVNESDWYCSELVWAAYMSQSLDIEVTGIVNEPGITPRDIIRSSDVYEINFTSASTK